MDNELFYEYADLVRKYKSGDEEAFSEIYDRSSRFVYMTCLNTLGNPEDAQDAMQETYLTVVNDIGKLEDNEKFLGWIKKIAVYKSIDIQRKRRDGISYDDAIETEEILEGDDDLESLPEYFIEEKAKREELHKIIKNVLSEDQYQTVLFYYFNEMSVKEIADVTGCPEGTIKRRLQNSRIKIKSGVEKYEKKTGDKLGAAAIGISFLGRFFKEEALGLTVPDFSSLTLSIGNTAKTISQSAAHSAAATAKTSFFSTVGGKIAVGAVSLAVIATAGIGIKLLSESNSNVADKEETEEEIVETTTEESEITEPSVSEESEAQEILYPPEGYAQVNCSGGSYYMDEFYPSDYGDLVATDFDFGSNVSLELWTDEDGYSWPTYPNYPAGEDIVITFKCDEDLDWGTIMRYADGVDPTFAVFDENADLICIAQTTANHTSGIEVDGEVVEEESMTYECNISDYLTNNNGTYTLTIPAEYVVPGYIFSIHLSTEQTSGWYLSGEEPAKDEFVEFYVRCS